MLISDFTYIVYNNLFSYVSVFFLFFALLYLLNKKKILSIFDPSLFLLFVFSIDIATFFMLFIGNYISSLNLVSLIFLHLAFIYGYFSGHTKNFSYKFGNQFSNLNIYRYQTFYRIFYVLFILTFFVLMLFDSARFTNIDKNLLIKNNGYLFQILSILFFYCTVILLIYSFKFKNYKNLLIVLLLAFILSFLSASKVGVFLLLIFISTIFIRPNLFILNKKLPLILLVSFFSFFILNSYFYNSDYLIIDIVKIFFRRLIQTSDIYIYGFNYESSHFFNSSNNILLFFSSLSDSLNNLLGNELDDSVSRKVFYEVNKFYSYDSPNSRLPFLVNFFIPLSLSPFFVLIFGFILGKIRCSIMMSRYFIFLSPAFILIPLVAVDAPYNIGRLKYILFIFILIFLSRARLGRQK